MEMKIVFFHIAVNRRFSEDGIKARLYLSPKHHNLHELAVQFINNSLKAGSDIYFKYARESDRLDRVVVYLKDQEDIYQKINLLSNIKNEYPSLFKDMQKSKVWLMKLKFHMFFWNQNHYSKIVWAVKVVMERCLKEH